MGTNFPEVPPEVLHYMGGQGRESEQPPCNRRTRRTHAKAKGVIINLFCGPNPKKWSGIGGDSFVWLHLDTLLGSQYSLHNPQVWAYLLGVGFEGGSDSGRPALSHRIEDAEQLSTGARATQGQGRRPMAPASPPGL